MIELTVPGDKSISHRALILACMAEGESRIEGLLVSADTEATASCLRAIGAQIPALGDQPLVIRGPVSWTSNGQVLDCANSGTAARLLTGFAVGLGLGVTLDGDSSLRGRPMDRVVYPLQAMGGQITYSGFRDRLPVTVRARASGDLRVLRHRGRVASAQVKSSLLLAGLASRTRVEVWEPVLSRDHTETLFAEHGAPIVKSQADGGHWARFDPDGWNGRLRPLSFRVPGDISSAAYLLAASLCGTRAVRLQGMGLNPTRLGLLTVLGAMGARIQSEVTGSAGGESVGRLIAQPSALRPFRIREELVPSLIDEIPLLCALAVRADGVSHVEGAGELRVKESDRIGLMADNLGALGVRCEVRPDGLSVHGSGDPLAGRVRTAGDHRMAMAFGVLASLPGSRIEIDDRECVAVSYPGFWSDLAKLLPRAEAPVRP
ncbi:MAG: 3-phosphoshikimate 1-carboxyvinyltransferase [Gemmatimonadota bacterium]